MSNINRVVISGRLTKDPDIKEATTKDGKPFKIARYTIACSRAPRPGESDVTDFIPVVAFGGFAEFVSKYFVKGQKVSVDGHIQTGSYTNTSGQKVYTWEVVAENQDFAGSRPGTPVPAQDDQSIPEAAPGTLPFV